MSNQCNKIFFGKTYARPWKYKFMVDQKNIKHNLNIAKDKTDPRHWGFLVFFSAFLNNYAIFSCATDKISWQINLLRGWLSHLTMNLLVLEDSPFSLKAESFLIGFEIEVWLRSSHPEVGGVQPWPISNLQRRCWWWQSRWCWWWWRRYWWWRRWRCWWRCSPLPERCCSPISNLQIPTWSSCALLTKQSFKSWLQRIIKCRLISKFIQSQSKNSKSDARIFGESFRSTISPICPLLKSYRAPFFERDESQNRKWFALSDEL